jgi:hypothetical protein
LTEDVNFAGGRAHQAGEKSQEGCLAGTVRACNREHLSRLKSEIYAVEDSDSAERAPESADVEQR